MAALSSILAKLKKASVKAGKGKGKGKGKSGGT